jgi:hypothetical protein
MQISRRTFLASAAIGLTFAGGGAIASIGDHQLVRATLQRMLGELHISDAELKLFTDAFKANWQGLKGYQGQLAKLMEFSGLASIQNYGPAMLSDTIERYERRLLTDFLLWTDYLDTGAKGNQTAFLGSAGCQNPFANFS